MNLNFYLDTKENEFKNKKYSTVPTNNPKFLQGYIITLRI